VHASASSGGGKRISQNEFTEKAWQAVVAAPDIAKQYQQQIVVRATSSLLERIPRLANHKHSRRASCCNARENSP